MSKNHNNNDKFVFIPHDDIGTSAAEDDSLFLTECFVDTGNIQILLDCKNPKRIIVGRTGAGKSALLQTIGNRSEKVIQLSPHDLSLNYIANNDVISFFEVAGVNLDVFYGLLWRHILVVELLKRKFNITNEESQKNYTRHIRNLLYKKDRIKEQAVEYLENWGNKFWLTTDERMKELTSRIEENLSASVAGKFAGVSLSVDGAKKLTTEQKIEVIQIGKKVVSEVQVRELDNIISVLSSDIFDDYQEHYFITIDMLDEEWADNRIRFKLIKSLIDSTRRFRKVENVKIIVALRQDLLNKVLYSTREQGFQEEKYKSLYLYLKWNKDQLKELIEKRINVLVKRRYTKTKITLDDIMPIQIDGVSALDYLLHRTFFRPRDIIIFLNECISCAEGSSKLTASIIKHAEEQYSYERLQSLATEWLLFYPDLFTIAQIFYGLPDHFKVSSLTKDYFEEKFTEISADLTNIKNDPITQKIDSLFTMSGNFESVRSYVLREFYMIGLLGLKISPTSSISWNYQATMSLSPGQVKANAIVYVHPMFHRSLGIKMKNKH